MNESMQSLVLPSLVPRPFEEEEKGPGTHSLASQPLTPKGLACETRYTLFAHAPLPQESWGLGYYSKLLRFTNPYTSLRYHSTLGFELLRMCTCYISYPQTFVFLLRFTCQYYYPRVRCEFTDNFTVSFTENMTHAQTVCTRPFLLLLKGPGDEARYCHHGGLPGT